MSSKQDLEVSGVQLPQPEYRRGRTDPGTDEFQDRVSQLTGAGLVGKPRAEKKEGRRLRGFVRGIRSLCSLYETFSSIRKAGDFGDAGPPTWVNRAGTGIGTEVPVAVPGSTTGERISITAVYFEKSQTLRVYPSKRVKRDPAGYMAALARRYGTPAMQVTSEMQFARGEEVIRDRKRAGTSGRVRAAAVTTLDGWSPNEVDDEDPVEYNISETTASLIYTLVESDDDEFLMHGAPGVRVTEHHKLGTSSDTDVSNSPSGANRTTQDTYRDLHRTNGQQREGSVEGSQLMALTRSEMGPRGSHSQSIGSHGGRVVHIPDPQSKNPSKQTTGHTGMFRAGSPDSSPERGMFGGRPKTTGRSGFERKVRSNQQCTDVVQSRYGGSDDPASRAQGSPNSGDSSDSSGAPEPKQSNRFHSVRGVPESVLKRSSGSSRAYELSDASANGQLTTQLRVVQEKLEQLEKTQQKRDLRGLDPDDCLISPRSTLNRNGPIYKVGNDVPDTELALLLRRMGRHFGMRRDELKIEHKTLYTSFDEVPEPKGTRKMQVARPELTNEIVLLVKKPFPASISGFLRGRDSIVRILIKVLSGTRVNTRREGLELVWQAYEQRATTLKDITRFDKARDRAARVHGLSDSERAEEWMERINTMIQKEQRAGVDADFGSGDIEQAKESVDEWLDAMFDDIPPYEGESLFGDFSTKFERIVEMRLKVRTELVRAEPGITEEARLLERVFVGQSTELREMYDTIFPTVVGLHRGFAARRILATYNAIFLVLKYYEGEYKPVTAIVGWAPPDKRGTFRINLSKKNHCSNEHTLLLDRLKKVEERDRDRGSRRERSGSDQHRPSIDPNGGPVPKDLGSTMQSTKSSTGSVNQIRRDSLDSIHHELHESYDGNNEASGFDNSDREGEGSSGTVYQSSTDPEVEMSARYRHTSYMSDELRGKLIPKYDRDIDTGLRWMKITRPDGSVKYGRSKDPEQACILGCLGLCSLGSACTLSEIMLTASQKTDLRNLLKKEGIDDSELGKMAGAVFRAAQAKGRALDCKDASEAHATHGFRPQNQTPIAILAKIRFGYPLAAKDANGTTSESVREIRKKLKAVGRPFQLFRSGVPV
jgi:hypothetical protein